MALPGGLGTLDELTEMMTWNQLGLHSKPIGILNIDGFYDGWIQWLDQATAEGLIKSVFRDQYTFIDTDAQRLLSRMTAFRATPELAKFITRA